MEIGIMLACQCCKRLRPKEKFIKQGTSKKRCYDCNELYRQAEYYSVEGRSCDIWRKFKKDGRSDVLGLVREDFLKESNLVIGEFIKQFPKASPALRMVNNTLVPHDTGRDKPLIGQTWNEVYKTLFKAKYGFEAEVVVPRLKPPKITLVSDQARELLKIGPRVIQSFKDDPALQARRKKKAIETASFNNRKSSMTEGVLYVGHILSDPDFTKGGETDDQDKRRIAAQTSVPRGDFFVDYVSPEVTDRKAAEALVKKLLRPNAVRPDFPKPDWFLGDRNEIIAVTAYVASLFAKK